MNKTKIFIGVAIIVAASAYVFTVGFKLPGVGLAKPGEPVSFLKTPEGFSITFFAKGLNDPEGMAFDSKGRMVVSETREGKVVLLEDKNNDGLAESTILLDGLHNPFGLAFYKDGKTKKDYLYVAETKQVLRFEYDAKNGKILNKVGKNIVNMPAEGLDPRRNIAFGPNFQTKPIVNTLEEETMSSTKLYVSVDSSCQACIESSWKNGAVLESDPDGNYTAEFAGGLRDSLFFDLNPITKQIWAIDAGRTDLGSLIPPDEINVLKPNEKYGWPFCYGNQVKDKTFNPGKVNRTDIPQDCTKTEIPLLLLPAHSSPSGFAFVNSANWPENFRRGLLVGLKSGFDYKIVFYELNDAGLLVKTNNSAVSRDFIAGWANNGSPTYIKAGPEGAFYVSNGNSGQIYKITAQ